ncbi:MULTISPECIES: terminase large subunit [unclassified Mesorhizobium]|uniref:terminase large subunit domain-containing protein n=1 Tax=unclassified Mesorhizobium TaxID=325217 RepID=UPI001FEEA7B3|nr:MULTISPECIES: terminase large subunit [unclassified Mesorhizobium]
MANITIDTALRDPNLLGAALGQSTTWDTWIAILRAAYGLELSTEELIAFNAVAGGREPPSKRVRELWCIIGRRSGKSRIAAALADFIAAFHDHSNKLAPGEVGTILVLAASRVQAQAVFNYIRAFFEASPILSQLVESVTNDEIKVAGNIAIAVHTNNYRTVRGRTLIACIFDEVGFWRDESTSLPDVETYRAVLPALATTGGMLIGISSPYAQRGLLYTKHRDCFGKNDAQVLVVQAGTKVFNPTIDTEVIDQAHRDDPESAAAEWDAKFRGDLSTFVDRAVVERCVDIGVKERPYLRQYRYVAFCDPSGGAHDSMTLGIAHREGDRSVLDCLREQKPPFDPHDVVGEFCRVLNTYKITSATGDRYAGAWVSEAFKKEGVRYVAAERTRSEIYLDALPQLMGGITSLLDNTRLVGQISQLERRTTRTGRDNIDHMSGASDDLANAALGAVMHVPSLNRADANHYGGGSRAPVVNLSHAGMKAKTGRYGPVPMKGPSRNG